MSGADRPLEGIRVVEVAFGVSVVGAGLAASLPGALLRDLGAEVVRVESGPASTLDSGVEFTRAWDRGKERVRPGEKAEQAVLSLVADADVALLAGPEERIERRGLGVHQLTRRNGRLVAVRIRPSFNALGPMPDLELLVAARAGLPTQIRGREPGRPVFPDLAVGQAGAAFAAVVGALAGLYEREATGTGGWAETSLYEGLQAMLPMIIGRAEHHSASTRLLWQEQGPAEALCYRCADGGYIQLWFGAKGAYEEFLEHIGDPPSPDGYNAELMSGAMVERGGRWAARFATRDRAWWLDHLAGHNFRCEPVLAPGEALLDRHVRQTGLAADGEDEEGRPFTALGPPVRVRAGDAAKGEDAPAAQPGRLLTGVRILDLSAYLAGPIAPLVLGELGADVVKVERVTGDAHRGMEPMFAAGQRGKRAVALDMKAPGAAGILDRLFRWSDVVHHNSRVGLAERLGYDEATVRAANPGVVYSFASGFGEEGPRARLPANDQLMQALSGVEHGQAGAGGPPRFLVWGAVDVAGGWLAACGILAGLYARRRTGQGQSVRSSLLGAGLVLKSGAHVRAGSVVGGPVLDAEQLGYGAAYRLYQGGDGAWFALAVPGRTEWDAVRRVAAVDGLPEAPPPLRTGPDGADPAEAELEKAFLGRAASSWVAELRAAGVPVEPVPDADREAFAASFLDDPVNLQLGRVVAYRWGDRGRVDQTRLAPRVGPAPGPDRPAGIAGLGEHTGAILAELGFGAEERARLAEAGTVRLPPSDQPCLTTPRS